MTDREYEQAKEILRRLAASGRLVDPDRHASAVFVSFGAEWFRREFADSFRLRELGRFDKFHDAELSLIAKHQTLIVVEIEDRVRVPGKFVVSID